MGHLWDSPQWVVMDLTAARTRARGERPSVARFDEVGKPTSSGDATQTELGHVAQHGCWRQCLFGGTQASGIGRRVTSPVGAADAVSSGKVAFDHGGGGRASTRMRGSGAAGHTRPVARPARNAARAARRRGGRARTLRLKRLSTVCITGNNG